MNEINVLHIIASIDLTHGGPPKSVCDLALNQAMKGANVTILTRTSLKPYFDESPHHRLRLVFIKNQTFKKALLNQINETKFDILHGHTLWLLPIHNMSSSARRFSIPYIITTRGTLEPWSLNQKKWKKRIAMFLYQKYDLIKSKCIHATAKTELDNILKLNFNKPIALIPNGIDVEELPLKTNKINPNKYTILFLSRIHPKKGIEFLISAWSQINKTIRENWQVEIAGNGNEDYIYILQKQINEAGLQGEISIIGPQFGKDKLEAYHRANLFVLPTYSENFGVVVAEALACGVPVITTKGTPWEELNTHNAGWWIDIGALSLKNTLLEAMTLDEEKRKQMGLNGRKLIEKNYSIDSVASKTIQLYNWILGEEDKPDFVFEK